MNYNRKKLIKELHFKQECASLNKEYKKDYNKYYGLNLLEEWTYKPFEDKEFNDKVTKYYADNFNSNIWYLKKAIAEKEHFLREKYPHLWPINPIDPSASSDIFLFSIDRVFIDAFNVMERAFLISDEHLTKGLLYMPRIDIKLPMTMIMAVLEEWIRIWRNKYFKKHPEHKNIRVCIPERNLALKVFRHRLTGWKYKDIAENVGVTINNAIKLFKIGYKCVYGREYKREKAFIKRAKDLITLCNKCSKYKVCKRPCDAYEKLSNKGLLFNPRGIPITNWNMSSDEAYYNLLMRKRGRHKAKKEQERDDMPDKQPY